MLFDKIDEEPVRAEKLSQTGAVYYLRWHRDGEDYVQIIDVVGGSGAGNGTYSSELYRLNDIGMDRVYTGYNLVDGSSRTTNDNNMSGFLRAAKEDIIRRIKEQMETNI